MTSFATASTAERRRFLWLHAAAPALVFATVAAALELTSFDRRVAELLVADGRGWLGADAWWANQLLHAGGKDLVVAIGVVALGVAVVSRFSGALRPWGRSALYVAATLAFGAGTVSLLKDATNVDCPRDLSLFGGSRPYVRLLEDKPDDLPAGKCWPGGHSSGAFGLFGLYFVARERHRSLARAALFGILGLGTLFAFGQWSRGAHFVSHDLWSAAICWFVGVGFYLFVFRGRLGSPIPETLEAEHHVVESPGRSGAAVLVAPRSVRS